MAMKKKKKGYAKGGAVAKKMKMRNGGMAMKKKGWRGGAAAVRNCRHEEEGLWPAAVRSRR